MNFAFLVPHIPLYTAHGEDGKLVSSVVVSLSSAYNRLLVFLHISGIRLLVFVYISHPMVLRFVGNHAPSVSGGLSPKTSCVTKIKEGG